MNARRAGRRWQEGAPDYILDCFDDPKFTDRYTVLFVETDGIIPYLGMSDAPTSPQGFSQYGELSRSEAAGYRYRAGKRRIAWLTLPEYIRRHAIERWTAA